MSPQPVRNELCAQMNPRGAVAARPVREAPHIQAGRGGLFPSARATTRSGRAPGTLGTAAGLLPRPRAPLGPTGGRQKLQAVNAVWSE